MLVNPHMSEYDGHPVSPDVSSLPEAPQLAVIATPTASVPALIAQLGARGCKAAIVITAVFGETGEDGRRLQHAMLDAAKPNVLRILGPNCFCTVIPHLGLNTSFGRVMLQAGRIALVFQSGAINATAVGAAALIATPIEEQFRQRYAAPEQCAMFAKQGKRTSSIISAATPTATASCPSAEA